MIINIPGHLTIATANTKNYIYSKKLRFKIYEIEKKKNKMHIQLWSD